MVELEEGEAGTTMRAAAAVLLAAARVQILAVARLAAQVRLRAEEVILQHRAEQVAAVVGIRAVVVAAGTMAAVVVVQAMRIRPGLQERCLPQEVERIPVSQARELEEVHPDHLAKQE